MKLRCTKVCASVARTFFLGAKSIGGGEDAATAMATMTIGSSFPLEGCMDGRRATGNSPTKTRRPMMSRGERGAKIGKGAHRALRRGEGGRERAPGTDYSLAMSKRVFINCRVR